MSRGNLRKVCNENLLLISSWPSLKEPIDLAAERRSKSEEKEKDLRGKIVKQDYRQDGEGKKEIDFTI